MTQPPGGTALTWGYCIRCGSYVLGRPVAMIEDRAEAVDGHMDCPATRPGTGDPGERPERGRS